VTRRILLVDADAFFVAVARLVDPEGAGKSPLLVVGGRPGGRGVVCSASYEARAFGVRSAMPISRAERLCPGAMFVPVPRGVCSRKSREIGAVLHRFAPVVQPASIDEWYLDLTGTEALYRDAPLADVAREIRGAVREATGLSVSLGGGTNRLVAKVAVEVAKPKPGSAGTGVYVVAPGDEAAFMRGVSLADIPMVGPRLRDRLEAAGLRTVPQVLDAGMPTIQRLLGERAARWLLDRASGIDDSEVHPRERAKSVSHEETFGEDINDDVQLETELVRLVTRVGSDLRRKGLAARTITVKLKDRDFRSRGASRSLPTAVVADRVVLQVARGLLQRLRRGRRIPARLLGVGLSGLDEGDSDGQLSLFGAEGAAEDEETPRDRALTSAVDALRERFGADAIVPGRLAGSSGTRRPREDDGRTPNASRVAGDRPPARGTVARRSGRSR